MNQIPIENDENRSVAASNFVKLEPSDEVPDQEEQPQFGLEQNPLDWTMDTGSTHNNDENVLKEQKLMIEKLEVFLGWDREVFTGNCTGLSLIIALLN
jgi:hypothetical protein